MTDYPESKPIRILPEMVANQIAAGEVVERPASVLKELAENALDAGASRVVIEIAGAGRRLIRVVDDGAGMGPDDLLMALERHATSKISQASDLEGVTSLGFRGEALPSIASVSRLLLRSRPRGTDYGSQVRASGGTIQEVEQVGCPQGTLVEVRDLFFNTPARRKFLKSRATESGHLGSALVRLALAHPQVAFRYLAEGQALYELPASDDLAQRVAALLGRETAGAMVRLDEEAGPLRVWGLAGLPSLSRPSLDQVYTFVNGRHVRDRVLLHAVNQAYRGLLASDRRPVMVVHLELDPRLVDVNVHPAKVEVRFRRSQEVHDSLVQCLRQGLAQARSRAPRPAPASDSVPPPLAGPPPAPALPRAPEPPARPETLPPASPPLAPKPRSEPPAGPPPEPLAAEPLGVSAPRPRPLFGPPAELTVIGQLHGLYILCSSPQGLVVLDQHAAHERLAYEQLRKALQQGDMPRQGLITPCTLELSPQEAAWAQSQAPAWARLGLELEAFGGNTWAVRTVPPLLAGRDPGPVVRDLLSQMAAGGAAPDTPDFLEQALRSLACRSAIKQGQRLALQEASELVSRVAALDPPLTCPHGRPVLLTIGRGELARAFQRSGRDN